jgi:hypothetical protein
LSISITRNPKAIKPAKGPRLPGETQLGSWKCRQCGFLVVIQPARPLRFCPRCGRPIAQGQGDYAINVDKKRGAQVRDTLVGNLVRALDDEIEHIKKVSGSRSYVIRNGERIGQVVGKVVYRFDYDGDRLETDVPVSLQIGEEKEKIEAEIVSVVGQEITLATKSQLPDAIPKAKMFADPLFILEKLRDRISSPQENFNSSLAKRLFAEDTPNLGRVDVKTSDDLNEYQKSAIERCAGSEVFFIWGPPGTGKTTTIASIVADAFASAKTALVTSNTNVAVDNAIAGAEKSIRVSVGYQPGDIVRVGVPQAPVPDSVLPEHASRQRREEIEKEISLLHKRSADLLGQANRLREHARILDELNHTIEDEHVQRGLLDSAARDLAAAHHDASELHDKLEKAKTTSRVLRAIRRLNIDEIEADLNRKMERERSCKNELSSAEIAHAKSVARLGKMKEQASVVTGTRSQINERSNWALAESQRNTARIVQLQESIADIEKEVVAKAKIVGTTLAKTWLRSEIVNRRFDLVVVDEASMATLPMLYYVSGLGNERILVAGDFKQIPAIVMANTENTKRWLRRNIFEVAGVTGSESRTELCEMLRLQYRMNPDISRIVSTHIYNGLLQDHASATRGPNVDKPPGAGYSLVILDTSALDPWCLKKEESHSRVNLIHAELALYMAKNAIQNGFTKIGIITPYRAQARILARRIEDEQLRKNVEVATVHRFQGREKQVVIFDISDGRPHDASRLISTKRDQENQSEKLLNVAVSRAQDKLVLIANLRYLDEQVGTDELLSKIISDCKRDGIHFLGEQFLTFPAETVERTQDQIEDGIPNYRAEDFYSEFESDLANAKQDIAIVSAFVTARRVKKLEQAFRNVIEKGATIRILTKPPETQFDDEEMKQSAIEGVRILKNLGARVELKQQTHEKLAVIDNAIVWHGSLNILSQHKSSESMMRFIGENTARQLLADVGLKAENVLRPESFTDIKDGMRAVTATGKVVQIGPTQFRRQRSGPTYRFAQAVLEADGRQCKLTLWGAETDLVKKGDRIRIINGYTKEYNGVTTLQSGKYGKIEVLRK